MYLVLDFEGGLDALGRFRGRVSVVGLRALLLSHCSREKRKSIEAEEQEAGHLAVRCCIRGVPGIHEISGRT